MAENLYNLNDIKRANALIEKSADYIQKELTYLADVSESKQRFVGGQNVQLGMSFLNQMAHTTEQHQQTAAEQEIAKPVQRIGIKVCTILPDGRKLMDRNCMDLGQSIS